MACRRYQVFAMSSAICRREERSRGNKSVFRTELLLSSFSAHFCDGSLLCFFTVPAEGQRNQDQKRSGFTSESDQILPCSMQVSLFFFMSSIWMLLPVWQLLVNCSIEEDKHTLRNLSGRNRYQYVLHRWILRTGKGQGGWSKRCKTLGTWQARTKQFRETGKQISSCHTVSEGRNGDWLADGYGVAFWGNGKILELVLIV